MTGPTRVGVVGAGYVGLTTAACLAHLGHRVICADVDVEKVAGLSRGEVPIREEGLAPLVAEGLAAGRLSFALGAAGAAAADIVFLCVPSPQGDDGHADLSAVREVAAEVGPVLRAGATVVNKSTLPVGSTRLVGRLLAEAGAAPRRFTVVCNPEFLREGSAVRDFLRPHRIVVGCDTPGRAEPVVELYRDVPAPVLVLGCASAEMVKYAANAFLATKVSFVNEVAALCEAVGADVRDVAGGIGLDPRIGPEFLRPGPGYGGSCLPKDVAALLATAQMVGCDLGVLRAVAETNTRQRDRIVAKIRRAAGGRLTGASVAVWGLTFKAGTDDLRDSPALAVVARLLAEGATVRAYDPAAPVGAGRSIAGLPAATTVTMTDPYSACTGADVLAILTDWEEFRWVDFGRVRALLGRPALVDARNLLDPAALAGFRYEGVGRPRAAEGAESPRRLLEAAS
ncbi:MAG: UDPglucose 6-dehydrogenase [Actinomycetota bacterium]|nr:UDPglucose 6-dehydrogenase [Actinomycetota bacterium]